MTTITLRSTKGSPLTNTEIDNNFSNLNNDKIEVVNGATAGNIPQFDAGGQLVDSNVAVTDKADKVTAPTAGNLAALDASGNLTDAGVAASAKADKVTGATSGHVATLDANGNLTDSGNAIGDLRGFRGTLSNGRTSQYDGDLNAIAVNAIYNINPTSLNMANAPTDLTGWGFLQHFEHVNTIGYATQILWSMSSGAYKVWMRHKSVNVWGAWSTAFNLNTPNAATLDGLDSTQFLRSDTSDILTGFLTVRGPTSIGAINVDPADATSSTYFILRDINYATRALLAYSQVGLNAQFQVRVANSTNVAARAVLFEAGHGRLDAGGVAGSDASEVFRWDSAGTKTTGDHTITGSLILPDGTLSSAAGGTLNWAGSSVWTQANVASQAQAEAGVDNSTGMTPLRTAQAIAALAPSASVSYALLVNTTTQSVTVANVWQRRTSWTLHETFGAQTWLTRNDATGQFTINEAGAYRIRYVDTSFYNSSVTVDSLSTAIQVVSGASTQRRCESVRTSSANVTSNGFISEITLQLAIGDVIEPVIYASSTTPYFGYGSRCELQIEKVA